MIPIVQREARKAARSFPEFGWTADDLINEFYVWMHEHPDKGWDQLNPDDPGDIDFLGRTAYYTTREFVTRGDAYRASKADPQALSRVCSVQDAGPVMPEAVTRGGAPYERDELEALLPGIWSVDVSIYGVQRETQRDPEMPKGQGPNPSHGFTAAAKVADVKQAWKYANLTLRQRQCILLRHGADMTTSEAGNTLGIVKSKVSEHTTEGVTRMLAYLNG